MVDGTAIRHIHSYGTHARSTRPLYWNVARFRQFQALEIPRQATVSPLVQEPERLDRQLLQVGARSRVDSRNGREVGEVDLEPGAVLPVNAKAGFDSETKAIQKLSRLGGTPVIGADSWGRSHVNYHVRKSATTDVRCA